MLQIKNKIEVAINLLKKNIIEKTETLSGFEWCEDGYCPSNEPSEGVEWKKYNGEIMTKVDAHYWFRGKINIPKAEDGKTVKFRVTTGHEPHDQSVRPQILMFIKGQPTYVFDTRHHTAVIPEGEHDALINFYTVSTTHEFVYWITDVCNFKTTLEWVRNSVEALEYDMRVLFETLQLHEETSFEYAELLGVLDRACITLDFRRPGSEEFLKSVDRARKILADYYKKWANNRITITAVALIMGICGILAWDNWASIFPILAMVIGTPLLWTRKPTVIRYTGLFLISPGWLIYNITVFSIAGIITETLNIGSILISFLRYKGFKNTENT